jgi:hypothetical protein
MAEQDRGRPPTDDELAATFETLTDDARRALYDQNPAAWHEAMKAVGRRNEKRAFGP